MEPGSAIVRWCSCVWGVSCAIAARREIHPRGLDSRPVLSSTLLLASAWDSTAVVKDIPLIEARMA
jgi:hypothetical protein